MAKDVTPKEVAKQDVAVKYVGEVVYHGGDAAAGHKSITVRKDAVAMVSAAKADQLFEDFPDQWEKATAKDAKKSADDAAKTEAPATPAGDAPATDAPAPATTAPKAKKGKGKK
jgi:hypothetical protein